MTAAATAPPRTEEAPLRGWGEHFVRTSGLVLFVLLAAHFVELFVLHDIQVENPASFADRWANPLWRAADWALIVLALVHGTIGLRPVMGSGIRNERLRGLLLGVLYAVVAVLIALVTFVAFSFRYLR